MQVGGGKNKGNLRIILKTSDRGRRRVILKEFCNRKGGLFRLGKCLKGPRRFANREKISQPPRLEGSALDIWKWARGREKKAVWPRKREGGERWKR